MNVLLALSVFYLYIIIMSLNPFDAEDPSCKKIIFLNLIYLRLFLKLASKLTILSLDWLNPIPNYIDR